MNLKQMLARFTLGSTAMLLSIGFVACANPSTPESTAQSPADSMAQSPGSMSGMDHSSMDHGSTNMDLGTQNATFDLRFLDGMMPHHQGAIEMAQEALEKSNRSEIKQLAQAIIDAQQLEISQMQTWRKAWYADAPAAPVMYDAQTQTDMPMSEQMRMSMMMSGDLGAADEQFDLRFINAMTTHHQAAIDMAQQARQNSDRPEIKELAQNIIDSQQQEIDQVQQWKQSWYGQ